METMDAQDQHALDEERQAFWRDASIPVNETWEKDGTDFANPVEIADMFVRATGMAAELAAEAEALTEAVANAEYIRDEAKLDYMRLRRSILAHNISSIKSGWSAEAVEAFILACAGDRAAELLRLEKLVDDAEREIRVRRPRLEKIRNRLKRLETSMDWAKQYLDYEKLMQRVTGHQTGRR